MVRSVLLPRAILASLALSIAVPALAQVPNGNEQNGFDYQPTQGQVSQREQAAGLTPSARQQRDMNRQVEQIDKQLLRSEGVNPGKSAGVGARPGVSTP